MLKNLNAKTIGMDLLIDIVGSIFIAISVQVFAAPANFATGGVNGIALIVNYLFDTRMGLVIILTNIPLIIISYRYMGINFLLKSIKTLVIGALIMDVLAPPFIPQYNGSPLLAAVFNGLLAGIGYAMIYMRGTSTGGVDFIILAINKFRPHASVGFITQVIDGIVIIFGGLCFKNVDSILYGIISVLVTAYVVDKIMLGANVGKIAFIITEKSVEIAESINESVGRGSTFIKTQGAYTRADQNMVYCACATRELYKIKKVVAAKDPDAFMVVTESTEVYGEGFNPIMDKQ